MSKIKISIIIPIYNAEKYLEKCLCSAINQELKEIEIICINDGSVDNSIDILNKYVEQDKRIKLIDSANHGVSHARNLGLSQAQGEYIMFLDADDYYFEKTCKNAYRKMSETGADIGVFGNYELYDNGFISGWTSSLLDKTAKKENKDYSIFLAYVWDKIFKKDFIKKHNIKFKEGIQTAEDGIFALECYFNQPKYTLINEKLYVYRKNNLSSTTQRDDCIKTDYEAFKALYNLTAFKEQAIDFQYQIISNYLNATHYYLQKNPSNQNYEASQLLIKFLNNTYSKKRLNKLKTYKKLKNYRASKILRKFLSIRNSEDRKFKEITIAGLKFKIRRNNVETRAN